MADCRTADEAMRAALDTVREAFGWAYGSYWNLDSKENALRFALQSGSVNEEFQRVTADARFREGEGLGRAWKGRATWSSWPTWARCGTAAAPGGAVPG